MFRSLRIFMLYLIPFMVMASSVPVQAQLPITSGSTSRNLVFVMFATGTSTPTAGLTVTVTLSKNGGVFVAATGTVTAVGSGAYSYAPVVADSNTLGSLVLRATATGADPCLKEFNVTAVNFDDPSLFGLTGIATGANQALVKAKTDLIATNAGDSPNTVTAQGQTASNNTSLGTLTTRIPGVVQPQTGDSYLRLGAPVGASISADIAAVAASVWGVAARTLTAFAFTPSLSANDENALASLYGSYTVPGGSVFKTITLANAPSGTSDTPGVTTLLTRLPSPLTITAGGVTIGGYAAGQDPATLLNASTVDVITLHQSQVLTLALTFDADRTWNATTHTAVLTWYRRGAGTISTPDKTKPVMVKTTVYDSTNTQVVSQTVAVTTANLN